MLAHSLLGCAFCGAFAAKVVIVRSGRLPGLALPIAGGLTFAVIVAALVHEAQIDAIAEFVAGPAGS